MHRFVTSRVARWSGITAMALLLLAVTLPGGSLASPSAVPIVIGGTLGLTGPFAGPSAEYKIVYDYWLQQINAHGGLLGQPVKMIIYNDESTPTTAQSLYNRLISEDHVDLLLSPYTTFVGGAVVPIVLSHKMLLFNGGFVGISIFNRANGWVIGSYTYQEPNYTRGVFELIKTLPADQRPRRVGILTAQNPFPVVVRDGFEGHGGAVNFAKEAGMQVVLNEQYPPGTTDFSGLILKAKAAGVDLLFELGLPDDSLQVARTVKEAGFRPKIFCTCGSQVTTLPAWPKLGAVAEGVIGTTIAWPNEKFAGLADLAALFKAHGETDIPAYGVVSYTILQVLQQAVEGAKSLDQEKLRAYILSHTFKTAAGNITYQPNGTPTYSQIILQFIHGRNEVLWPSRYATAHALIPLP